MGIGMQKHLYLSLFVLALVRPLFRSSAIPIVRHSRCRLDEPRQRWKRNSASTTSNLILFPSVGHLKELEASRVRFLFVVRKNHVPIYFENRKGESVFTKQYQMSS